MERVGGGGGKKEGKGVINGGCPPGGAQHRRPAHGGHPPAVKRRHHRPPFNWCKAKQIRATLCLHRDSPASETNRSRNTIFSDPGSRCTYPFEKSGLGPTSPIHGGRLEGLPALSLQMAGEALVHLEHGHLVLSRYLPELIVRQDFAAASL